MAKAKKITGASVSKDISKLIASEKKGSKKLGHYSFIVGVILALIAGIFVDPIRSPFVGPIVGVLVILGVIVGFLNISHKETLGFLIASAVLLLVGTANLSFVGWGVGITLQAMLVYTRVFVAPAALIVALKTIAILAED